MEKQQVIVTDFDMSFGNMVGFMIKWAFATIPAVIIIVILGMMGMALLAALGATALHH
jgi:cobalamin biosynthesis protein CbiD